MAKSRRPSAQRPSSRRARADKAAETARAQPQTQAGPRRKRRVLKTSELIAREIVLDIAEGGLKEGDPLPPEASMVAHYGVGRASLREALRLLEVQGLVQIRAGARGGPVVGSATAENLARMLTLYFGLAGATYADLSKVMLIVYPKIAEVAASSALTRAEAASLRASVEVACAAPNPRLVKSETLKDFHSLLPSLSQNPVWTLLSDAVGLIFADHVMTTSDSRELHAVSIKDHEDIANAILARDPELASSLMLEHTERMIDFYREQNPAIFDQVIEWR